MQYIDEALVHIFEGGSLKLSGIVAYKFYLDWKNESKKEFLLEDNNKFYYVDRDKILLVTFKENEHISNKYNDIIEKWDEIINITGIDDCYGDYEWFTVNNTTYINSLDYEVSKNPKVANLLYEIEKLEDNIFYLVKKSNDKAKSKLLDASYPVDNNDYFDFNYSIRSAQNAQFF